MSRQILFVQGGGDGTHDAWDNKLVDSLTAELGEGYELRYPPMPNEGEPDYATWKAALVKEFADLDDDAILAGHSIGGTFLIHTVAEQHPKRRWSAIALIAAPYLGDGGWSGDTTDPAANLSEALRPDGRQPRLTAIMPALPSSAR